MLKKPRTTQQSTNRAVTDGGQQQHYDDDGPLSYGKLCILSTPLTRSETDSCDGRLECTEHVQGRSDSAGGQRDGGIQTGYIGGLARIGHVLTKEVNNDSAVAGFGWKPVGKRNRGRPKTRRRETEWMEHMGNSKTGRKQPPAVEGGCPALVPLLARRDLTHVFYLLLCHETRACSCLLPRHPAVGAQRYTGGLNLLGIRDFSPPHEPLRQPPKSREAPG